MLLVSTPRGVWATQSLVLKGNLGKHPADRDSLLALVTFNRDSGDVAAALAYAERLAQLDPGDRQISELVADAQAST